MRILSVSDLHYRLPHYDWLVRAAADQMVAERLLLPADAQRAADQAGQGQLAKLR